MRRRRLWLCLPPTLLVGIDHALTMWFQRPEYWAGDYAQAQEACPPAEWLMKQHPLANEAGLLGWVLLIWILIVALPRLAGLTLCLCVTIGHTWGASSWINDHLEPPYWYNIALCILSGAALALAVEAATARSRPAAALDADPARW